MDPEPSTSFSVGGSSSTCNHYFFASGESDRESARLYRDVVQNLPLQQTHALSVMSFTALLWQSIAVFRQALS
jgi:hypothetical protein